MATVKRPRWLDSAEKYFREHFDGGAGGPKSIARTCCEVSAWYNDRQIRSEVVVDVKAVQDGLDAYALVHAGEQPFIEVDVEIQTCWPYKAIVLL